MKKLSVALFFLFGVLLTSQAQIDSTVKKIGNKTAEIASKGKSDLVDVIYKDKVGAQGQTIYIDHSSKYYYVDKKGKKVYVAKSTLMNKPKK